MFYLYNYMIIPIIKSLKVLLLALVVITTSKTSIAKPLKTVESCKAQNLPPRELSQCLDIVKDHAEKVLQTWVNNQTFILEDLASLTGRHSALNMFKRSQKSFISYRETNCRWQYLANLPGLEAPPAYKMCFILLTNNRINELSQMKNE